jgi:hypothetical protein
VLQAAGRKCVVPPLFVSGVAFLLFDMLSECACDHGYLIQNCLQSAIACLVALCLVRVRCDACFLFLLFWFVFPPSVFAPKNDEYCFCCYCAHQALAVPRLYMPRVVFLGRPMCMRYTAAAFTVLIGHVTIAWGASYMVLIL